MNNTKIEWTDATWGPTRGCSAVGAACDNCYAQTIAHRFSGKGLPYEGLTTNGEWNGDIMVVEKHLADPLRWEKPRRIFVNSMSDLFHPRTPTDVIDHIFAIMALCPQHTFQILTKRPAAIRDYLADDGLLMRVVLHAAKYVQERNDINLDRQRRGKELLPSICIPMGWHTDKMPNIHFGVSVWDQKSADAMIPILLATRAATLFISAEPLLGPLDLCNVAAGLGYASNVLAGYRHDFGVPMADLSAALDWVIVGGESGPRARPMDLDWVRGIRDQCADAGVPFMLKQTMVNGKKVTLPRLDGRVHDEYPTAAGVPK